MSDMNKICQYQVIWRIFTRVRACIYEQTGRQTECINTFQLCWEVLKIINKNWNRRFFPPEFFMFWYILIAGKLEMWFSQIHEFSYNYVGSLVKDLFRWFTTTTFLKSQFLFIWRGRREIQKQSRICVYFLTVESF